MRFSAVMKPLVLTVTIPASVLRCQVNTDNDIAAGPAPEIPQLQLLDQYAGHWEDEIGGKPGMRRTETGEWILQGRFLRQCWSSENAEGDQMASGMTLMTFDTERATYRSWSFLAAGSVIENEGVWDASDHTFTWRHHLPDTSETIVTKASFVDNGMQSWSIVKTDAEGKVVREVVGRSSRRNTPALQAA